MTITQNHDGGWIISAVIDGYLASKIYYGYTKDEAVECFKIEEGVDDA